VYFDLRLIFEFCVLRSMRRRAEASITFLYATVTGNSREAAEILAYEAERKRYGKLKIRSIDEFKVFFLLASRLCTATTFCSSSSFMFCRLKHFQKKKLLFFVLVLLVKEIVQILSKYQSIDGGGVVVLYVIRNSPTPSVSFTHTKSFWKFLLRADLPSNSLSNVKFAVFGLGNIMMSVENEKKKN
jgi:sulfite reductase alpha subunit-like flavoprotein